MDHPVLSVEEFLLHFRGKAFELGFDSVLSIDLSGTESTACPQSHAAMGIVISGSVWAGTPSHEEALLAGEQFAFSRPEGLEFKSGPDGARLILALRTLKSPA